MYFGCDLISIKGQKNYAQPQESLNNLNEDRETNLMGCKFPLSVETDPGISSNNLKNLRLSA